MTSSNDWAAKAAHEIFMETIFWSWNNWHPDKMEESEKRIAAIIATFAEPLVALLRESKRSGPAQGSKQSNDAWNARVEAALAGQEAAGGPTGKAAGAQAGPETDRS